MNMKNVNPKKRREVGLRDVIDLQHIETSSVNYVTFLP